MEKFPEVNNIKVKEDQSTLKPSRKCFSFSVDSILTSVSSKIKNNNNNSTPPSKTINKENEKEDSLSCSDDFSTRSGSTDLEEEKISAVTDKQMESDNQEWVNVSEVPQSPLMTKLPSITIPNHLMGTELLQSNIWSSFQHLERQMALSRVFASKLLIAFIISKVLIAIFKEFLLINDIEISFC